MLGLLLWCPQRRRMSLKSSLQYIKIYCAAGEGIGIEGGKGTIEINDFMKF